MKEYSVIIITKNESRIIGKTVKEWQKISDDVIIIDAFSEDDTTQIAKELGARVYQKEWEGFSANKNYGIQLAKNDWILCPDADEIPDNTLIFSLKNLNPESNTAYKMNILTYMVDKPVWFCGWHPDWNIRLFNRNEMSWNGFKVHEKLIAKSKYATKNLAGKIHHHSYVSKKHFENKLDHYAKLRALDWIENNNAPNFFKRFYGPPFRFFRTFFLKLGFLDGFLGFYISKAEYRYKTNEWKYYDILKRGNTK